MKISEEVDRAFAADESLRSRVASACQATDTTLLLHDIARYILNLDPPLLAAARKRTREPDNAASVSKKVKVENGNGVPLQTSGQSVIWRESGSPSFAASDVSFVVPVRKKLRFELVGMADDGAAGGMRGINPANGQCEAGLSWGDIAQVIMVPVPEKATPSFSFVIIPSAASGITPPSDALVFTVNPKPPKDVTFREPFENDSYELYIERALNSALAGHPLGMQVVVPTADEFESKSLQGRRKGECMWHVKAFRGSKEGYLYFLPTGVLWGFKKPVVWFPLEEVTSVSYSSILQRTFNLNITANLGGDDLEDLEFGMVDQVDFEGIDAYVKRHGLNDASLAEGRKAKKFNVNAARGDVGQPGEMAEEVESELEKAQRLERELQDMEDEGEEDFEASGGDSDGSGSDSGSEIDGGGQDDEVEAEDDE